MPTLYRISRIRTLIIANSEVNSRGLPKFTLLDVDTLILGWPFAPSDKSGVGEDNHKELAKETSSRNERDKEWAFSTDVLLAKQVSRAT